MSFCYQLSTPPGLTSRDQTVFSFHGGQDICQYCQSQGNGGDKHRKRLRDQSGTLNKVQKKNQKKGRAGEMVQEVRVLAAKSNSLSSVPETHTAEGEKAKGERESVFRKLSTAGWRRPKGRVPRAGPLYQSTASKTPGTHHAVMKNQILSPTRGAWRCIRPHSRF